jgi:hypothetical protein
MRLCYAIANARDIASWQSRCAAASCGNDGGSPRGRGAGKRVMTEDVDRGRRLHDRFIAGDPGLLRLRKAGRTALAAGASAIAAHYLLSMFAPGQPLTVTLLAGMVAYVANFAVNDTGQRSQFVTTLLILVPVPPAIALVVLLSGSLLLINGALLVIVFCAFYLRRFGQRFVGLGTITFVIFYFADLVHAKQAQLVPMVGATVLGVAIAVVVRFVLFHERPLRTLQRSIDAFIARLALSLDTLLAGVGDGVLSGHEQQTFDGHLLALRREVAALDGQLDDLTLEQQRSLDTDALRLSLFDAELALDALADAVRQLAQARPPPSELEYETLRRLLAAARDAVRGETTAAPLGSTVRDAADGDRAGLLATDGAQSARDLHLLRLRNAAQRLRRAVRRLRRAQRIRAATVQRRPRSGNTAQPAADTGEKPYGIEPTTATAIQATVATALAALIGYRVSSSHPYWTVIAAFVVFAGTRSVGTVLIKALQRVGGTFAGVLLGYLVSRAAAGSTEAIVVVMLVTILLAVYLFDVSYTWFILGITVMLALLYDLLLGKAQPVVLELRLLDTVIGAAIGWGAATLILPSRATDQAAEQLAGFACALKPYVAGCLAAIRGEPAARDLVQEAFALERRAQEIRANAAALRGEAGLHGRWRSTGQMTAVLTIAACAQHLGRIASYGRSVAPGSALDQALARAGAAISRDCDALQTANARATRGDPTHNPAVAGDGGNADPERGPRRPLTALYYARALDQGLQALSRASIDDRR